MNRHRPAAAIGHQEVGYVGSNTTVGIVVFDPHRLAEALEEAQSMAFEKACDLPQAHLYKVKRPMPVKADQRMKSETLAVLSPGEVVSLAERAGKWVSVEYFNQLTGTARQGWVLKKYMCRID
ncbi:hypothetical protein A6A04_11555 [Paramagnetospirillum marisnigri]|uniref:SH3b domain-containing protein n=2 Tax=Paramagnetospirillum marisnigri TaxID=1285242 RepID=A0A178MZQ9_9PROT|nr:hypothetical protein A6A04_11555 [Paramagnetospirillum marisnigri]